LSLAAVTRICVPVLGAFRYRPSGPTTVAGVPPSVPEIPAVGFVPSEPPSVLETLPGLGLVPPGLVCARAGVVMRIAAAVGASHSSNLTILPPFTPRGL
jgi:hypothetical protein